MMSDPIAYASVTWRVAQRCESGACVRVARYGEMIVVGDTKNPNGPVLPYMKAAWREFVNRVKNGEFDDPM